MKGTPARLRRAYAVVRRTFGVRVTPIFTLGGFVSLRTSVAVGMFADRLFSRRLKRSRVVAPIVLVGNPRTGSTFLQRFLTQHKIGAGMELWQMLYPSLTLQWFMRPMLPVLERISPARHHSTVAHATSLTSVETDDVGVLFRHFDGFFLYGFLLAFADDDLRKEFDHHHRDTNDRDFAWLEALWRRRVASQTSDRIVAKLFSLAPRVPEFQMRFPDAKIIYLVRDPLESIPSGMSLVTSVLDKRFGFWSLPDDIRDRYLHRLYSGLVELLSRFHADWTKGRIDREHTCIIRYDRMMSDFESVMDVLLEFVGHEPDEPLRRAIREQAETQRKHKSKHLYDLQRFGLDANQVCTDCHFIYETFLNDSNTKPVSGQGAEQDEDEPTAQD